MVDALVQQRHAQQVGAVGQPGIGQLKAAQDVGVPITLLDGVAVVEVQPVVLQEIGVEGQAQQPVFARGADVEFGDALFLIFLGVETADVADPLDVIDHAVVRYVEFHRFVEVVVEGDFSKAAVVGLVAGAGEQVSDEKGEEE